MTLAARVFILAVLGLREVCGLLLVKVLPPDFGCLGPELDLIVGFNLS